jgi:pimeloyl-ACP methyl ester carboxylesterase
MLQNQFLYDECGTRYFLAHSNRGKSYNWIFIPGGPGCGSQCFLSLLELLQLPGNSWLIDFPANGDNTRGVDLNYNFDTWSDCLRVLTSKFQNTVYVGHSFGGMFPLLFPELESQLKGLIILNSAPCLWIEAASNMAKAKNLPTFTAEMDEFSKTPSQETFKKALMSCMPYYFPKTTLALGMKLLEKTPFNFYASPWWYKKAQESNFSAKWVPQAVPTLIIGGTEDCICPVSLFQEDKRFHRSNVVQKVIEGAGHVPWVEEPETVKQIFWSFIEEKLK